MVYAWQAGKAWYKNFEVDSTESVWYSINTIEMLREIILKLTPQSQYGIDSCALDVQRE